MSQVWWHAGEAEAGSSQVQSQPGLYIKILPPKKKKRKKMIPRLLKQRVFR
jgi:hypothetical protein